MSEKFSNAIKVNEIEEIYDILAKENCPECNISLEVQSQSTSEYQEKFYDTLLAECPDCKRTFTYIFDVTIPFNSRSKFF